MKEESIYGVTLCYCPNSDVSGAPPKIVNETDFPTHKSYWYNGGYNLSSLVAGMTTKPKALAYLLAACINAICKDYQNPHLLHNELLKIKEYRKAFEEVTEDIERTKRLQQKSGIIPLDSDKGGA